MISQEYIYFWSVIANTEPVSEVYQNFIQSWYEGSIKYNVSFFEYHCKLEHHVVQIIVQPATINEDSVFGHIPRYFATTVIKLVDCFVCITESALNIRVNAVFVF